MAAGLSAYIKPHWRGAVLVCARCSDRFGPGFGRSGRERLASALRRQLGIRRFRRATIGVVEVGCLGICPRDAVTVANPGIPDRYALATPEGELSALIDRLGLSDHAA
ncbi:MAG: hypothetical protein C0476_11470 [Sphingomonas sp.]|nr:hypothetical protein [Sphingomonas sp.]